MKLVNNGQEHVVKIMALACVVNNVMWRRNKMKNSGRTNIWGLLFIILIVAVIMGKASFWHIIFFPFYMVAGLLGIILGIVLLAAFIFVIVLILSYFFD